jgi:hypothetical protein
MRGVFNAFQKFLSMMKRPLTFSPLLPFTPAPNPQKTNL